MQSEDTELNFPIVLCSLSLQSMGTILIEIGSWNEERGWRRGSVTVSLSTQLKPSCCLWPGDGQVHLWPKHSKFYHLKGKWRMRKIRGILHEMCLFHAGYLRQARSCLPMAKTSQASMVPFTSKQRLNFSSQVLTLTKIKNCHQA